MEENRKNQADNVAKEIKEPLLKKYKISSLQTAIKVDRTQSALELTRRDPQQTDIVVNASEHGKVDGHNCLLCDKCEHFMVCVCG